VPHFVISIHVSLIIHKTLNDLHDVTVIQPIVSIVPFLLRVDVLLTVMPAAVEGFLFKWLFYRTD